MGCRGRGERTGEKGDGVEDGDELVEEDDEEAVVREGVGVLGALVVDDDLTAGPHRHVARLGQQLTHLHLNTAGTAAV